MLSVPVSLMPQANSGRLYQLFLMEPTIDRGMRYSHLRIFWISKRILPETARGGPGEQQSVFLHIFTQWGIFVFSSLDLSLTALVFFVSRYRAIHEAAIPSGDISFEFPADGAGAASQGCRDMTDAFFLSPHSC
jgi:hypothetical protein